MWGPVVEEIVVQNNIGIKKSTKIKTKHLQRQSDWSWKPTLYLSIKSVPAVGLA